MATLHYTVSFKGVAGDMLRAAFDDCDVEIAPGRTLVRCETELLHDVLDRLQRYGLELLDVRLVAALGDADRADEH